MTTLDDSKMAFKAALALRKTAMRREKQLFLLEGVRELNVALAAKWPIHCLFFCTSLYAGTLNTSLKALNVPTHTLTARDFSRLVYREDSGGIVAVAHMQPRTLSHIKMRSHPLILVLDGIEKPGNIGATFRIAAATSIDAILLCGTSDPYNANVVRNSLGAVFSVPWVQIEAQAAHRWLQQQCLQVLGLDPNASISYTEARLDKGIALVLGAEASGLHAFWKMHCHELLSIPIHTSCIDSLNVASTAAVISYEALRQRNVVVS